MELRGIQPHPKTGVYWLRLRTPSHLVARRRELEKRGVTFRVEHHRSLRTRSRSEAIRAYPARRAEIEEIWQGYEANLNPSQIRLSGKSIDALAGSRAKAFFERHEANPYDAPIDIDIPARPFYDEQQYARVWNSLTPAVREALVAEAQQPLPPASTKQFWHFFEQKYPFLKPFLGQQLMGVLEAMFGSDADELLREKAIEIDAQSRAFLNLALLRFMGKAKSGIEERLKGNWGPVPEFDNLPKFEEPKRKQRRDDPTLPSAAISLTFDSVIDEQERLSGQGLAKQRRSSHTFGGYRREVRLFTTWRNSTSIESVTRLEAQQWLESMLEKLERRELNAKTIRNRIGSVRSVIAWAIKQNAKKRLEDNAVPHIFPQGNPLAGLDLPEWHKKPSEELTHPKSFASHVLECTRQESLRSHIRWVPWIEAYSGMRIGEISQLEKRDLMEYEGSYYLYVRYDEHRTVKNRKSRRVPIHRALIDEGFIEFVRSRPEGRIFPKGKMGVDVAEWIRGIAKGFGGLGSRQPNHAFRHLFKDISTGRMDFAAYCYVAGRALPNSAEDYGGSPAMVPILAEMMNRIPPLLST